MLQRRWLAFTWGVCVAVAVGGGCSSKDRAAAAGNPNDSLLRIDVAPASVVADGKNTVTVTVTAATGAVNLTSTKGLFVRGSQLLTLQPGETTATLTTCDSVADKTCAGNAVISATDSSTTLPKTKNITFTQAEICDNGIDDDAVPATSPGSGKTDCFDPACLNQMCRVGGGGADSGVPTMGVCGSNGVCTCVNEMPESCTDDMDNNCNGKIDCADTMCANQPCKLTMTTQGLCSPSTGKCACPKTAEDCSNMVDDDCDGLTDCQDLDCQGDGGALSCANASGGLITVTAPQALVPADGTTTVPITAYVRNSAGGPLAGQAVTFALDMGSVGSLSPMMATTDSSGRATVTFTASSTAGTASIRASYTAAAATVTSDPLMLSMPQLGQIKFISQQWSVMGNKGSNYNETNDLVFQVLYSNTTPYPPGLIVNFTHQSQGETFIGVSPTCSTVTPPNGGAPFVQCVATGVTDAMGMVHVLLHSGNTDPIVSVTATAQAGGSGVVTATTGNITIVGGKPSGLQIGITCSPYNIPGFVGSDCTMSGYNGQINCAINLGDRFRKALAVPAQVTVASEAGHANPALPTLQYDPNKPGDRSSQGVGKTSTSIDILKGPLPVDVTPASDEYSYMYTDKCGPKTHNPRDGLVTIIASARGEEGFVDSNANGQYDLGENFLDLGEPYVDANDNNIRDDDEYYIDLNKSNTWDPPDGVWNADTTIWATTRVVYTDWWSYLTDGSGKEVLSRWTNNCSWCAPLGMCASSPVPTAPIREDMFSAVSNPGGLAEQRTVAVYITDQNFNVPGQQFSFAADAVPIAVTAVDNGVAKSFEDQLGMSFSAQLCDAPTKAAAKSCGSSCDFAPCYAVTTVGCYQYGFWRTATLTCGHDPTVAFSARENVSLDVPDVVDATKHNTVTHSLGVAGACQ